MKDLIWAIPLFPLAGFLVNGIVHLLEHRTKGERVLHDPHGEQPAAESQKDLGHPHAHMHGEIHPRSKALHTAVGTVPPRWLTDPQ